jgi:GNAT superfamily N-acetyltransferase
VAITLNRTASDEACDLLDELLPVYVEVYSEPPYSRGPKDFEGFRSRYEQQSSMPGFELITATAAEGLAGFTYGLPFLAGRWWRGALEMPPPEVKDAPKFAIVELVVRRAYRGQGLGRKLMDTLLSQRPEKYATLLANPLAPARTMYERWGWRQVGTVQSHPHWDPSHAMVLPLHGSDSSQ